LPHDPAFARNDVEKSAFPLQPDLDADVQALDEISQ
jgi:hypothetical protein